MEMDSETGERCRDSETGEWVPYNNEYDDETGEPASTTESANLPKRRTFKIHPCYMKNSSNKFCPTSTTRDTSLALLFLLPTLFVYPGITSIIIAILEVVIHTWAHRVNKRMADKNVYYQSPMHIIASEFCAKCRDIKTMDKIEKLQDKRTLRFKCHYEYVKRIVT